MVGGWGVCVFAYSFAVGCGYVECQYSYFKLCFVRINQFSAMILPANNP